MDYKIKYLKYKQKYFQLKNNTSKYNFLNGGNTDIKVEEIKPNTDIKVEETKPNTDIKVEETKPNTDMKGEETKPNTDDNTRADDSTISDAKKKEEQDKFDKEINRPKVDQGR